MVCKQRIKLYAITDSNIILKNDIHPTLQNIYVMNVRLQEKKAYEIIVIDHDLVTIYLIITNNT